MKSDDTTSSAPGAEGADTFGRRMTCTLALVTFVAVAGCAVISPKTPRLFTAKPAYSWTQYEQDRDGYRAAMMSAGGPDIVASTDHRERMQQSIIGDVNWAYTTFRANFHALRSTAKTAADMMKLGLSAASTVLGGSAVLSGAVTALEGSQLSAEKNLLEEKTTALLLTTMDTLREERLAEIERKRAMPPPSYSFEEAYNDALALFGAGTVPSALERLAADAGDQDKAAQEDRKQAIEERVLMVLPKTTLDAVTAKRNLNAILTDIHRNGDEATLKAILNIRGVTIPADASFAQVSRLAFAELRNSRSPDEIDTMVGQFRTLGIWR